jgi:hypothetical protein
LAWPQIYDSDSWGTSLVQKNKHNPITLNEKFQKNPLLFLITLHFVRLLLLKLALCWQNSWMEGEEFRASSWPFHTYKFIPSSILNLHMFAVV